MPKINRILIIAHSYAPRLNPRAFRWTALAERFVKSGCEIDVVTFRDQGLKEYEIIGGVRVYRCCWHLFEQARAIAHADGALPYSANTSNVNTSNKNPKQTIGVLARACWRSVAWPDTCVVWYLPGRNCALRLLNKRRYDALITVGLPYTSIAIGLAVKRILPEIPWLVDLGDPFSLLVETPPNNLHLYSRLNRWYEGRVLQNASLLAVTNRRIATLYEISFPHAAHKVHVVPPLLSFDPSRFDRRVKSGPKKRLVYVGSLYATFRDPSWLLQLFRRACERLPYAGLELHFYGDTSLSKHCFEPFQDLIGNRIHLHGIVSRDHALAALHDADILLNVGNTTPFLLPSKIIEYVAAAKPIVNIVSREDDICVEFLKNYPDVLNLKVTEDAIMDEQLRMFCEFICKEREPLDASRIDQLLQPYRIESIAKQYLTLMEYS